MLTVDNIRYADIVIRRCAKSLKVKKDDKLGSSVNSNKGFTFTNVPSSKLKEVVSYLSIVYE
jgi:hypothetical protein